MEWLPGPMMTRDNYYSMQVPNVCSGEFPFGIEPETLEAVAPTYLGSASSRDRYPQFRRAHR